MIAFWSLTTIGVLSSLQYRDFRLEDQKESASLAERERRLDEENHRLDVELAELLREHRSLIERKHHG